MKKRSGMAERRVKPSRRLSTKEIKGIFLPVGGLEAGRSERVEIDADQAPHAVVSAHSGSSNESNDDVFAQHGSFSRQGIFAQYGFVESLKRYFLAHRRQSLQSLSDFVKRPWSNLLIVMMLGATLFVPLLFYSAFKHIGALQGHFDPNPLATVFFQPQLNHSQAMEVASGWRFLPGVLDVEVISKAQGIKDLLSSEQLSEELIGSLGRNPLPEVARIKLDGLSKEQAASLEETIKKTAGVDAVVLDVIWSERFVYFLGLMRKVAYVLIVALGLVVVLTIANVTRLSIENQRSHIQIAGLFGASPAFLRRPFLYQGIFLGGLGALISLIMLLIVKLFLSDSMGYLLQSYALDQTVVPLNFAMIVSIFCISCCLGILGAYLAVNQVLGRIDS